MEILSQGGRVFSCVAVGFLENRSVQIDRKPEANSLLDTVAVKCPDQPINPGTMLQFYRLVASVQKHLGKASSLVGVANLLGPSVREHFEAREIALDRLEKMTKTVLVEMEDGRRRRDEEMQGKERVESG